MPHLPQHDRMQGIADAFLRDGALYGPLLEYIDGVMTRDSQVHVHEREVIAAHVSRLNGCGFCVGVHGETLRAMGVPESVVDRFIEGDPSAGSPRLASALRFAEQLTVRPHSVDDDDIAALRRGGWSDQAIEDIVNVVSLFATVNRLVDAFGFVGTPPYFKKVGVLLAGDGYRRLSRRAKNKTTG